MYNIIYLLCSHREQCFLFIPSHVNKQTKNLLVLVNNVKILRVQF